MAGFDRNFYLLNMVSKSMQLLHELDDFCTSLEIIRSTSKGARLILAGFESGHVELFLYKHSPNATSNEPPAISSMGSFLTKNTQAVRHLLFDHGSKLILAISDEGDIFKQSLKKIVKILRISC